MAERLSDSRHQDEFDRMKGRLRALSVAAGLMDDVSESVFDGFHQLLVDAADEMQRCAEAFDDERKLRNADKGGKNG